MTAKEDYYRVLNGLLEPANLEPLLSGLFDYVVSSGELRYVLGTWNTTLNHGGARFEVRNPRNPLAMSGASMQGLSAGAYAVTLNPNATSCADPEGEYFRRLVLLNTTPLKFLPGIANSTNSSIPTITPFVAGPYGTLITRAYCHDGIVIGAGVGMHNELSNYANVVRFDNGVSVIMSNAILGMLQIWGVTAAIGGIAYYNLPAAWGSPDPLGCSSYVFRDDFMGTAIDPASWVVAESTPGNVKLDQRFNCVKGIGTNSYLNNGMISTATYSRSANLRFVADLWMGSNPTQSIFGLNDGGGLNFNNYNHGLIVDNSGVFTCEWKNQVGADAAVSHYAGTRRSFRVRITPGTANGALYEIQGGTLYPMIGSSVWFTLSDTRNTSLVDVATYKIGFTAYRPDAICGGQFLSDIRVY